MTSYLAGLEAMISLEDISIEFSLERGVSIEGGEVLEAYHMNLPSWNVFDPERLAPKFVDEITVDHNLKDDGQCNVESSALHSESHADLLISLWS